MENLEEMTSEELREAKHRAEMARAGAQAQIDRIAADVRTDTVAELVADEEFANLMRAKAWLRHEPDMTIARDFSDMPDGWPPSVEDPRAYLLGQIRERVDPAIAARFDASPATIAKAEATPSVEKLRSVVGRINGEDQPDA